MLVFVAILMVRTGHLQIVFRHVMEIQMRYVVVDGPIRFILHNAVNYYFKRKNIFKVNFR